MEEEQILKPIQLRHVAIDGKETEMMPVHNHDSLKEPREKGEAVESWSKETQLNQIKRKIYTGNVNRRKAQNNQTVMSV